MARDGAVYACQSCGAVQTKWSGQCSGCGAWNTLVEEVQARPPGALAPARGAAKGRGLNFEGLEDETPAPPRISTGVDEFDRVCGGGVVPGSAILLGGDPGVEGVVADEMSRDTIGDTQRAGEQRPVGVLDGQQSAGDELTRRRQASAAVSARRFDPGQLEGQPDAGPPARDVVVQVPIKTLESGIEIWCKGYEQDVYVDQIEGEGARQPAQAKALAISLPFVGALLDLLRDVGGGRVPK